MPIPKEILSVKRPVNTIVIMYGKNKDRFAVRQRIGCRMYSVNHFSNYYQVEFQDFSF